MTFRLVDRYFEKSLSKLVADLMLPAFIFCEVMTNFDKSNYFLLFHVFLGCITTYLIGVVVAYTYSKIVQSEENERNLFIALLSSPNTTSITLIMIEVLHPILNTYKYDYSDSQTGIMPANMPDARERGLMYISLTSIFSNLWRWSVTYNCIDPHVPKSGVEERLIEKENNTKEWKELLKEVLNVPIVVSIVTLILCMSSTVKFVFTDPDSILKMSFLSANQTIAKGYTFAAIFVLGLNIANIFYRDEDSTPKDKEEVSISKILTLSVLKLIVIPLIGAPFIFLFRSYHIMTDPVLVYLMLFILASPFAVNVLIICNLKKAWIEFISVLMIMTYGMCIVTITLSNAVFLYLLAE